LRDLKCLDIAGVALGFIVAARPSPIVHVYPM